MKKRLFLIVTVALFLLGAQTVSATEMNTGLMGPEIVDVPNTEADEVIDRETATPSGQSEVSEWGKYANYYYYNQLGSDLKAAWDALDEVCETYYSADKDVTNFYTNSSKKKCGRTEYVSLSKPMKAESLQIFWDMYTTSNPQYYFLANSYVRSYSTVQTGDEIEYNAIALGVYDAFWDGEVRASETAKVKQQLAVWQSEIDMCTSDAAKLQKMQDLICTKVTYNDDAAAGNVDEQLSFSQSPYSVICGDSTVCAGYADTFYMLCNASGIDAISVTSSNHQWNKVRVNDSWYNFDVTWDDNNTERRGYTVYLYHGRSDEMYDTDMGSGSASNISSHQEETFWEPYLPLCTFDTAPASPYTTPGTFPVAAKQVATPQIDVSYVNGVPQVTLSCETENAVLYYTTDGTVPSVADRNTFKYEGVFRADGDMKIKVLAVCDTYADSEIAVEVIEWEEYKITYILDGGENHADNPDSYTVRDEVTLQLPSKAGYIFDGWYVDNGYKQIATKIAAGSTGAYTFYAKWIPITYTLSFNGNGSTSGSMSPLAACNYDTTYALTANKYVKTGYAFTGWNTEADGSGESYSDQADVYNMDTKNTDTVVLYAQWRPIVYKISFNGNGATSGSMSPLAACNYDTTYALTANKYVKTGYAFTGWNTEADGSGTAYADNASVKNLSTADGKTITLYAQWKAHAYAIAFNGNKATKGSMTSMSSLIYGKTYTLSSNKFKRTGYKFTGWNTKKNGKGISYKNKSSIRNLTHVNGEVITLYAQWKANKYTVKFNGNGATSGSMKKMKKISYGKKYRLSANKFKKNGYKFVGWNTKKNGKGKMYKNKAKIKNLTSKNGKTVTLYAQWKKI